MSYDPFDYYWLVGNKVGLVFSSAAPGYVQQTDSGYVEFLAAGKLPARILCDGELADVLIKAGAPSGTIIAAGATSIGNLPSAAGLAAIIATGCKITSTATPALNGTYGIDPVSQGQVTAESIYIQATTAQGSAKFTNGLTTKPWSDALGGLHTFTTTQFISFAEALAQYVDGLATTSATLAAGGTATWPAQPISIA